MYSPTALAASLPDDAPIVLVFGAFAVGMIKPEDHPYVRHPHYSTLTPFTSLLPSLCTPPSLLHTNPLHLSTPILMYATLTPFTSLPTHIYSFIYVVLSDARSSVYIRVPAEWLGGHQSSAGSHREQLGDCLEQLGDCLMNS